MSPSDRELVDQLVRNCGEVASALETHSEMIKDLMASNLVLTLACGNLYAELADGGHDVEELDTMLERLLAGVEARPDSERKVFEVAHTIRVVAEAVSVSLRSSRH